jgi:predicted dehydrogenase
MAFGTLIVGLGQIGMGYDLHLDPQTYVYSHARAFSQHPRFRLAAGVDPNPGNRRQFEQTYQTPAYVDLETALHACQPDVAVLALPTPLHRETLHHLLALSAPKAILCEKPLAYGLDESRQMTSACEARDTQLFVNYMRRSDPGALEIKRRLETGEIAGPIKGVVWYSKGLLHNGSHFFNLAEYWLGPVRSTRMIDCGRDWDGHDPEPDIQVKFERGTLTFLAAREEAFSHYTMEIVAANGRLRYEHGGRLIGWQPAMPSPTFKGYAGLSADSERIDSGMNRYQWHVAEQLTAALEQRPFHLCTGAQALTTLETLHAIIATRDS